MASFVHNFTSFPTIRNILTALINLNGQVGVLGRIALLVRLYLGRLYSLVPFEVSQVVSNLTAVLDFLTVRTLNDFESLDWSRALEIVVLAI